MMDILCHYIDHTMFDPRTMAARSAEIKSRAQDLARHDVLLVTTCLRIELYGSRAAVNRLSRSVMNGTEPAVLSGPIAATQRLAEIASGAHSQLLGESYISQQLSQSIQLLPPSSAVRQLAEKALRIGDTVKARNLFVAVADYDKIVMDILEECLGSGTRGETLYLVGAGMLGRSILFSGLPRRFTTTRVLTRDPKSLRKKMRSVALPSMYFHHPAELLPNAERQSAFVVATSNVPPEYGSLLEQLIGRIAPAKLIELSSLPVLDGRFGDSPTYVNMYSREFLSCVDANNASLSDTAGRVKRNIADLVRSDMASDVLLTKAS